MIKQAITRRSGRLRNKSILLVAKLKQNINLCRIPDFLFWRFWQLPTPTCEVAYLQCCRFETSYILFKINELRSNNPTYIITEKQLKSSETADLKQQMLPSINCQWHAT